MATFLQTQSRYAYLAGESGSSNLDATDKSHINAAINDIVNAFPFSWNIKTTTGSLSSGSFNLASDFNPKWHVLDARIVNSGSGDDNIFTEVPIVERDKWVSGDYVYWITYDTSSDVYVFNSNTQSGTVTYYYQFVPTDLSADADVCIVPDKELVAYLAVSKNWIGDERNTDLKREYEQEAQTRIQALYRDDLVFGAVPSIGSIVDYNTELTNRASSGFKFN